MVLQINYSVKLKKVSNGTYPKCLSSKNGWFIIPITGTPVFLLYIPIKTVTHFKPFVEIPDSVFISSAFIYSAVASVSYFVYLIKVCILITSSETYRINPNWKICNI